MTDYQTLDISPWCNAGNEVLVEGEQAEGGHQLLRGLPFLVGSEDDKLFISLNGSSANVTIPVGKSALRVIFAHRMVESNLPDGGSAGEHVADYVFLLANREQVVVPIRERFEISALGGSFSRIGLPYRAVSDRNDERFPRYEGRWDAAGRHQTEAAPGLAEHYYLWAWKNPYPDQQVVSLEIAPKGASFLVAGVTLGNLDEHPFVREGRREARIVLTDPRDTDKPFDVDVEVDRGVATYAFPLPEKSADDFVDDSFKGWGEPLNEKSNLAYVEIAATPSATVTVKIGEDEAAKVNWGEVEQKGQVSTPRVRLELLDKGRNWVHVTVLDDDTGRPVPCRVHFRSPEGIPYQPHGHHNQVNSNMGTWHIDVGGDVRMGQITYAYIDGRCQGWLPRGEVIVDVARGYEYEALRTRVNIEPGQQELTLRIKRWTNMNAQRWFSGDSHVHFLSTQGSHLESQGEDLNVVNLLQSQWGSLFTNTEDFTGRPSVSQDGSNIVYTSQENRQHFLGHMILWGLKEPVMPWCSDGLSEAELGGTMETTMSHWADAAHAQGGTVITPHFPMPNGEAAALIATGRMDGAEMIRFEQFAHREYYRYLNCGYRIPLIGGTDKMGNDVPVGAYRTYTYIPEDEEFSYDNWRKNTTMGRTILSGGPIIQFSVDGRRVGDTVQLPGEGTVEIEARAESILPFHKLEIVQAGRVIASTKDRNGARRLQLKESVKVDGHTWFAARCGGPNYYDAAPHYDVWDRGVFGHTSPIYVAVGGEWQMFNEGSARYMLTNIGGALTYVDEITSHHRPGSITHHHGEVDHQAFLRRPFLEAQEAVQRRMRQNGVGR